HPDCVSRLIRRNENLIEFLAGTNTRECHFASRGYRLDEVHDFHAGDPRYKYLPALQKADGANYEVHTLLQREPKAGHSLIGDRHPAQFALLNKDRDDTAAATHNVAVSDTCKSCRPTTGIRISLNEELLGAQLGGAVDV